MSEDRSVIPTGSEAVALWRREVLDKVFAAMFFLLTALLAIETLLSLKSGKWHAIPALGLAVLLQGIAAFGRRFSLRARALVFTIAGWTGMALGLRACLLPWALPSSHR